MRARSVLHGTLVLILAMLVGSPALAQPATPEPVGGSTPLAELMHLMPDSVAPSVGYAYADYAQQLDARGLPDGADMAEDEIFPAVTGLPQPKVMFLPGPEWREAFGFDLRDVDQFLDVTLGDRYIAIFRGDFDPATLQSIWEASDYTPVQIQGTTIHSAGDDFLIDFEHPAHRLHVGQFSYLVALDERTVVGTSRLSEMEEVLQAHNGERATLAEGLAEPLMAAPPDLVGAQIVHGASLRFQFDPLSLMPLNPNATPEAFDHIAEQMEEMEAEAQRMPPIAMALVGYTAGDLGVEAESSTSVAVAVLAPLSPIAAELVAEVSADRFVRFDITGHPDWTGQRYADLFSDSTFETVAGGAAVRITLTPAPDGSALLLVRLLSYRSLSLFYW